MENPTAPAHPEPLIPIDFKSGGKKMSDVTIIGNDSIDL